MNLKFEIVEDDFFKKLSWDDEEYLTKYFYFYRSSYEEVFGAGKSKIIIAYTGERKAKNIVGLMKISRYLIENREAFQEEYKQEFVITQESGIDVTETYIHIEFVEVKEVLWNQGIGTALYKYLESKLTTLDIIYESYRTIAGKNANLLSKIEKCMAVDDFDLVYFS